MRAATPWPAENPVAAPAAAGSPHALKDPISVESLGDSPVSRRNGFEVVPGKNPNGWSFTLEPYGWAMGMAGDLGERGLPPTHVDFSAKDILQHLDWGGWVDPIIGLRGQVNFTCWLFLAVQGDVGGFGAGSWFAANVTATLGVNITRNIFLETGYRFFYMDRSNDGFTYNAGEYGLFSGIGLKF